MAESKQFWRDDEIVVDRDGIPHFTGAKPELMKEYRRRVLFAYNTLEGSGDDEAKEKRSLEKKRGRFAKKLLDALHGEAWKSCQDLLANPEKLRGADGYKQIFLGTSVHREGRGYQEDGGLRHLLRPQLPPPRAVYR